jgi:hypothetical protein
MSGSPTETPLPRDWPRVRVHPGTGLVDRRDDVLLVVPVLPATQAQPARELLELCHHPDPTGHARIDALRELLGLRPAAEIPGFALLFRTRGSLRALVHGPVRLLVDGRAQGQSAPHGGGGPAECVLEDGAWDGVTITADGHPADDQSAGRDVAGVLSFDLERGTVPGAGVTLVSDPSVRAPEFHAVDSTAAPAPGGSGTSETALRPVVRFRTVLLGECASHASGGRSAGGPARPPLPIAGAPGEARQTTTEPEVVVEGVHCPAGHVTDPERPTCLTCGRPCPPDAPRRRLPRPPLGVLVTDGGTIYTVTGDFVVGREAEEAPDVRAGRARPLPLRDAARSTSRVHARLTVTGWKVLLSDEGSANGTFLSRSGAAGPWLPVTRQLPVALVHGDRVRLGKRQLLFDTWRDSVVPQAFR